MTGMMPAPGSDVAAPVSPAVTRKRASESDDEELNVRYPAITDWLETLDVDWERGSDGLNYVQYKDVLTGNEGLGLVRLDELLAIKTPEKLQELTKFNWGTASRLMRYAKEDSKKLIGQAKKARTT